VAVPGRIGIISGAGEFLFISYRSGSTSILVYRSGLIYGRRSGLISILVNDRNGYGNRQTMNPGKSYPYMCINVHL
jgi:hypothetical protein